MEKRKEIDFVNILLCILVILIHILSRSVTSLDKTSIQYLAVLIPSRLASFVVQGFIFLSGIKYFMKYNENDFRYIPFLRTRVKTVLFPYILWNVIYYLTLIPLGYFKFNIFELIKYIAMGNMISHFYFVVIIMQFYILMPLWIKLLKIADERLILVGSLILMIVFGKYILMGFKYNDRIFFKYIFYWIAGCLAGRHFTEFLILVRKHKNKIIIMYVLIAAIDSVFTYLNNTKGFIPELEYIHILYCIIAIVFVFTVCGKLMVYVDNAFFAVINRQSYNIYLSHCLVLYYCDHFMNIAGVYSAKCVLLVRLLSCYIITYVLWRAYDTLMAKKVVQVAVDRDVDS